MWCGSPVTLNLTAPNVFCTVCQLLAVFLVFLYSFPYHNVFNMWSSFLHMFSATLRNAPRVVISNSVVFKTSKGNESY